VGGLFFDFEAVRTESSDRDAPRRSKSYGPYRKMLVWSQIQNKSSNGCTRDPAQR
jgi:hypothetical protein